MSINFESELMNPENWSKDDEVYLLASTLNNKPTGKIILCLNKLLFFNQ